MLPLAGGCIAAPPNIVLILADDLGWADLGCYGNRFNETPNLDRLAREGIRFTHAYAGPVCSPTRANLQSGRDQARFGITQHIPGHRRPFAKLRDPEIRRQLPLAVETFAERLRATGYSTGYFGKWHLGGEGFGPEQQGWQTTIECQGHNQPPERTGKALPQRTTEFLTEKAIEFIEANASKPFLLQVAHFAVHIPLSTTPDLLAKYEKKASPPGYPSNPAYAGLLEELDRSVGRIVEAVDRAGVGENTIIVFVSDNGGLEHEQSGTVVTSNAPLRGEKGTLYEGGVRVPCIVRWPGKTPTGTECDLPISTQDLHPTFAALAGAAAAEEPLDGVSLDRVLRDPTAKLDRDALYWHLPHYHHSTPASAVRRGHWKLIEFFEFDTVELYDLQNDPGESTNLATREPARAAELRSALAEWRKRVGARMPEPNPDYDPARATLLDKPRRRK